jgi:hypothetical protein
MKRLLPTVNDSLTLFWHYRAPPTKLEEAAVAPVSPPFFTSVLRGAKPGMLGFARFCSVLLGFARFCSVLHPLPHPPEFRRPATSWMQFLEDTKRTYLSQKMYVRINTARYDRYFFVEDQEFLHPPYVHSQGSRLSGRLFDIVVVAMRR